MLTLKRTPHEKCTTGVIQYHGNHVCYSLERPWLNNEPNISCIPAGTYDLQKYDSAKFPDCFSLLSHNLGVGLTEDYHRTYVLIHPANRVEQLHGCIATGTGISGYEETWTVQESRKALEALKVIIYNNNIMQLTIS